MEERSKWEKIIGSKLNDFEADVRPDDWKAIENRLPGKKVVFSRKWYYAAAGITIFLLITGGYYYFNQSSDEPMIAEMLTTQMEKTEETEEAGEIINDHETAFGGSQLRITNSQNHGVNYGTGNTVKIENSLQTATTEPSTGVLSLLPHSPKEKLEVKHNHIIQETLLSLKQLLVKNAETTQIEDFQYIADATPLKTQKKSGRRWSIGAGGGSYTVGSNGGGFVNLGRHDAAYSITALNNGEWYMATPVRRNDNFNEIFAGSLYSKTEYNETNVPMIDVSHKQPISLGIGVGYALDNRWTLQSGLVYTLLTSEWRSSLSFQSKSKQQLHFVGIPLGISYKIAEWNKIHFYANAGGMVEWNMGGNIKTKYYFFDKDPYKTDKDNIRMKETQWSVNARVGATYPVVKFINAYVEGGANYYFDNNSSFKTIRSEKPFHLSLQAGLRFGF